MRNPKSFRFTSWLSEFTFFRLTPHALRLTLALFFLAPLLLCTHSEVNAQWEPDVRLTFNDSCSFTSDNNIAVIGDTIHVVWYDHRHINHDWNREIYYKLSTNGGLTWEPDTRLTYDTAYSGYPTIAASGPNVHVTWHDSRDEFFPKIYYKRSTDAGATWGLDVRLTNIPARSFYPFIAVSDSFIHAVWEDSRGGGAHVFYKRSSDRGTTWGPDTSLTNNPANSYPSSIAASESLVHLVWIDYRDGIWPEIYYKRSTNWGLNWGMDIRLTQDSLTSYDPSVSASDSMVHVVWSDGRDGNAEIYYKRSMNGGASWGPDIRITSDSNVSFYPNIVVSGMKIHVVWDESRDGNIEIYYKCSTDGGTTWGADTRLTNDQTYSYNPSIAVSGSKVHIIWYDGRDGNSEIYYKRNPTGNSGVEVSPPLYLSPGLLIPLSVVPNPFTSFATLPGHEAERFALYDVSGRRVGTYRGDRVGAVLTPGVYFIKPEEKQSKPLRIVKLR